MHNVCALYEEYKQETKYDLLYCVTPLPIWVRETVYACVELEYLWGACELEYLWGACVILVQGVVLAALLLVLLVIDLQLLSHLLYTVLLHQLSRAKNADERKITTSSTPCLFNDKK